VFKTRHGTGDSPTRVDVNLAISTRVVHVTGIKAITASALALLPTGRHKNTRVRPCRFSTPNISSPMTLG
jgi:hypothetical protein